MKKMILLIGGVFLFNCQKKHKNESGLNDNLYIVLLDYQKKNPIPSDDEIKKKRIFINPKDAKYVFEVIIDKNEKDTLLSVTLESRGVKRENSSYGIYSDKNLKPTYIIDENKIGKNFIKEYKQRNLDTFTFKDLVIDDTMYPVYFYKAARNKLILYDSMRGNVKK
ncbi:hypothetical protein IW15_16525 [Chryseobacterium soli]|uniref:Uncharacterized protein n=1 Tax=Chryseobacterium soli TaxID=445961 RepID=A0A086A3T3_9FLAO|nr:hypothetical protein [Chryseobacterium soli]KFF11347.1 hypothetical protein IW15_16525 [Chryseobacterium soli]